jgi:tetratricopeptide (TPR) repeat protein
VSDETLTQRVALLRRALGDDARNPRYVRAVRGRGYQLIPPVTAAAATDLGDRALRAGGWRRVAWIGLPIAAVVLLALGYFLYPDGRHPPAPPPAVATQAASVAELLQRAGVYLGQHQEANNELAIELYQRALRLAPRDPEALAGLSLALSQRATKFNRPGDAGGGQALALARQAVALAPGLGRAHHALGLALDSRGEVSAALASYLRASRLEPQPAGAAALASAANLLQVQGHLAEALESDVRAARESGGDSPVYLEVQVGGTLALLGFDAAAAVWFERALELRPDNVFAAAAYAHARLSRGAAREADAIAARALQRGVRRPELDDIRGTVALLAGDSAAAKSFFAAALAISPGHLRANTRLLLLARQAPGGAADADLERRRRSLEEDLHRGRAEGDEWPDSGLDEALLAAAGGDDEAALHALDTAIGLGFRDDGWLRLDPMLAGLRRDPGFPPRLARIRALLDAERQRVLGAPWLPPALLGGSAARM